MTPEQLIWLPILAPLAFAFWAACVPRESKDLLRLVGLASPLLSLAALGYLWSGFNPAEAGFHYAVELPWAALPGFAMGFGVDAVSFPLLVASAVITLGAVLLVDSEEAEGATQTAMLLLTFGACNAAFLTTNLFWFFFFCELTTLPKFLLIQRYPENGSWLQTMPAARVALQMTAYIVLGAMAVLACLAFISSEAGTLSFAELVTASSSLSAPAQTCLYGLAIFGFGMWGSMWPLHGWAPPVYTTGKAPANMLFGGVVKSFGVYGLVRLATTALPLGAQTCGPVLIVCGCVGILYAGYACFRQSDWNSLLAYSSISHAGFAFVALGINTPQTIAALPILLFAHGVTGAAGFALSRELLRSTGSRDSTQLSGVAVALPRLGLGFSVFTVCACGLPGSATFVAELLVFFGVFDAQHEMSLIATAICAFGVVVGAVYMFRALHTTFFGKTEATAPALDKQMRVAPLVAIWVLIAASVVVGVCPRVFTDLLYTPDAEATAALSEIAP